MKWKYIFVTLLMLIWIAMICKVVSNRALHNPHHIVPDTEDLGPPPQASKPYNILDYTKPAVKP